MLTIVGFFLSSFFKLILQLESNTLYRGSKHEIVGSGSYLLFSILFFFFLPLSILDYIFHFLVNLFWMYTFLFYIGGSKVKCKRGIITTNCNCAYQKHKPFLSKKEKKKRLNYSSASTSPSMIIETKCVWGSYQK